MRASMTTRLVAILGLLLLVTAVPAIAQDGEEPSAAPGATSLERPSVGEPVEGVERTDGIVVLADEDFCSYVLGELWGRDKLTFRALIDGSRKQRKAKRASFRPYADAATLERCAGILDAFRQEAPEGDTLPAWARESPVVPTAVAALLPADLLSDPLAVPADIGDGARTTGFGDARTAPFVLWGGAYFIEVDADACDSWIGSIRSASDPSVEAAVIDATTYVYGVPTGNYFWDVEAADCDWSVDLVVFELPPDPTPTPVPKTEVPALRGPQWHPGAENPDFLTPEQAGEVLRELGLTVNICQVVRDPRIEGGRIAAQDPPAGTLVEPGSSIRVHVTWPSDCSPLPLTEDAQLL